MIRDFLYTPNNTVKPVADEVWIVDGPEIRFGIAHPARPWQGLRDQLPPGAGPSVSFCERGGLSFKPGFPRWLLPIADNGRTMGIRTRFRP